MSMENKMDHKKKPTWLYGIIALLLFLLVLETGLLLSPQSGKTSGSESRPVITHDTEDRESRMFSRPKSQHPAIQQPLEPDDPFGLGGNPMMELERMRAYVNRLFNTALTYGPPIAHSLSGSQMFDFMPTVDLEETDKAYIVKSDLPGLQKDKINVTVRDNLLTLQGVRETESTKEDEQGGFYAQERSYGSFSRMVTLPGPVDETQIKADYQNGVLTITLPKTGEAKTVKKVPIQ